jgi:hypothetical protein
MSHRQETDPANPSDDRRALLDVEDRLERERPVPRDTFRIDLRSLLTIPRQSAGRPRRWRALAASYIGLGFLCLAVAAAGLAGAGPFAA